MAALMVSQMRDVPFSRGLDFASRDGRSRKQTVEITLQQIVDPVREVEICCRIRCRTLKRLA